MKKSKTLFVGNMRRDFIIQMILMHLNRNKSLIKLKNYNIPQPEDVNYYDTVNTGYTKVLTENAKRILRQKIRDEKRENVKFFIQVVAGITGLIGVLIGLISIIKS